MKSRSRSRSNSANKINIRKHKRKNHIINENNSSSSVDSDQSMPNTRKQFTLQEKKEYIKKYEDIKNKNPKKGIRAIVAELNISYSSLREWIKQKPIILETKCKRNKYRLEGAGKIPNTIEIEEELIKWLEEQRRLEIGLTTNEIINKSLELYPENKNKSYSALHMWCFRFLKRYSYKIRAVTHIGQQLKENVENELHKFYEILYRMRSRIKELPDKNNIFNMEERPIYFEMVTKTTITKIGTKSLNVKTHGGEHLRITVMLAIGAKGIRLPSLVVFKGKKDAVKEERLQKYIKKNNRKIIALCQDNAWADREIFIKWLNYAFFNNKYVSNMLDKILVIDRATTHYDNKLESLLKEKNASYVLIPPGLTKYIQPLDVSINAPFKKYMHHWYIDYILENQNKKNLQKKIL